MSASFPLAYILIPFAVIVFIAALFFFFNIFHLKRYAIRSPASSYLIFGYVVSFFALIIIILIYLSTVDWSKRYSPGDLIPELEKSNRIPLEP